MQNRLIDKLDAFIRKYYKNELLKGGLFALTIILSSSLIIMLLEYYGRFDSLVRLVFFIILIAVSLLVVTWYIFRPIAKLLKIGKSLSYKEAAAIIGQHFSTINDKLLNTLQLQEQGNISESPLLTAAIDQKTLEMQPIPFVKAINLKNNLRYLKYLAIPLAVFIIVQLFLPGFESSATRIVNYQKHFEIEAPFDFIWINKQNKVVENDDVAFKVVAKGKFVPDEMKININGLPYIMQKLEGDTFFYSLKNIRQSQKLYFDASGFQSQSYELQVQKKPSIFNYSVKLLYPSHTGLQSEVINNFSQLKVPNGTIAQWQLRTKNTAALEVKYNQNRKEISANQGQIFNHQMNFIQSGEIAFKPFSKELIASDSVKFKIDIVQDQYPKIQFKVLNDSFSSKNLYMLGEIEDDYGFKKLTFNYRFSQSANEEKINQEYQQEVINLSPNQTLQSFKYYWNLAEINIEAGDEIQYFFEVWDNDKLAGYKSTKSAIRIFSAPDKKEIQEKLEKSDKIIKKGLDKVSGKSEDFEKQMQQLQEKFSEKRNLSWEEKQKINQMLNEQREMQEQLEKLKEEFEKKNMAEEEFKEVDPEIKEKQEDLKKLFDNSMDEEMKKLMEEIEKLMDKNQKPELMQKMKDFSFNNKEMQKQLERLKELYKQLELEKKLKDSVKKLQELAEKQKELDKETEEKGANSEDLKKKQDELKKELNEFKKDQKDIEEKNKALEKPLTDLKTGENERKNAENEMQKSSDELQKDNKKKSQPHQKKAAQELEKAAQEMEESIAESEEKRNMEDYNTLRSILENLVGLSHKQENLMSDFKQIKQYGNEYVNQSKIQREIKDDARLIEDSLLALSKRVPQVQSFINKEIGLVNHHLDEVIANLGERRLYQITANQQYVMTSLNNLALMLTESLKDMQQMMQSQSQKKSSGQKQCNNPNSQGQGKKQQQSDQMKGLSEMQKKLGEKLQEMQGKQKQGGKPSSKDFGEAAQMQEEIRQKLRELNGKLQKNGQQQLGNQITKTEKLMDDIEKELLNKKLNQAILRQQKEIEIRLSQHEEAQQKQEQDDKRKSNEGKDIEREFPDALKKYLKEQENQVEILKTSPPGLTPYYKEKVKEYLKNKAS